MNTSKRKSPGLAEKSSASSPPKRLSLPVLVRNIQIGGGAPVRVQSMTKTRTDDVTATVRSIRRLTAAGCELVRLAVPDAAAAAALPEIRARVDLPLIADIHFDYRLALAAIKAGFDKIRINPGNIGSIRRIEEIIRAAQDRGVAIRIGVNAGSLPKEVRARYRHPEVKALIEAMARALEPFERLNFKALVLSAKTTVAEDLIAVNEELAHRFPYPLHIGLTEAGPPLEGSIRSAAALAPLLRQGIGDTIRISLTGDPVLEVVAAYELLAALNRRQIKPVVYSCPGCGRTRIDIVRLTRQVQKSLQGITAPLKVAVMGCVVNGPGEAREADFGIAGGKGKGVLFVKGKVIGTYPESRLVAALGKEIKRHLNNEI
ncbi:MAG: flavodoxin-dependent (E)-4-hydroxy-3-methylbut-2-enyl-diphosphate synthase [candidate division WOR-3 bacterium]|jgi:(E)-4-hydroxy-3-methylbut-2-enyl-diphosphate synthase|nr:flavodoxin-dependent (E)-4-hydroxy-3-methylbut-2-enyl-diphosphate synthase [candidate division WOR-3 bacterium]MDH7519735.1 flavodoxin-dependent (E)-4-hydroxy-3-methylbut-2-enyl-diphosphate synthase [bacterium]